MTILGSNPSNEQECNILNPSTQDESSYEKSVDKGLIRNQVRIINIITTLTISNYLMYLTVHIA